LGLKKTSIPPVGSAAAATTTSTTSAPRTRDVLADFRKTIKRDPTLFMDYKDEKQWDTWQRSTIAQARAQGLEDVLNHAYNPSLPDDILLFQEKNKVMYAVFERCLKTDKGKALVRAHEMDFDAQDLY
jgi:hypothetical protein